MCVWLGGWVEPKVLMTMRQNSNTRHSFPLKSLQWKLKPVWCISVAKFILAYEVVVLLQPPFFSCLFFLCHEGIWSETSVYLWCARTVHLMNCKNKMKWKIMITQTVHCTCWQRIRAKTSTKIFYFSKYHTHTHKSVVSFNSEGNDRYTHIEPQLFLAIVCI